MQTAAVVLDVIILRHHSYNSRSSAMAFIPILALGLGIGCLLKSNRPKNNEIGLEFQSEINNLNASHANDMKSRDKIIAEKSAEIQQLATRLDQTLNEIDGLKQENNHLRAEVTSLKIQIDELTALIIQLVRENEQQMRQMEQILKQTSGMEIENRKILEQTRSMQQAIANQMVHSINRF